MMQRGGIKYTVLLMMYCFFSASVGVWADDDAKNGMLVVHLHNKRQSMLSVFQRNMGGKICFLENILLPASDGKHRLKDVVDIPDPDPSTAVVIDSYKVDEKDFFDVFAINTGGNNFSWLTFAVPILAKKGEFETPIREKLFPINSEEGNFPTSMVSLRKEKKGSDNEAARYLYVLNTRAASSNSISLFEYDQEAATIWHKRVVDTKIKTQVGRLGISPDQKFLVLSATGNRSVEQECTVTENQKETALKKPTDKNDSAVASASSMKVAAAMAADNAERDTGNGQIMLYRIGEGGLLAEPVVFKHDRHKGPTDFVFWRDQLLVYYTHSRTIVLFEISRMGELTVTSEINLPLLVQNASSARFVMNDHSNRINFLVDRTASKRSSVMLHLKLERYLLSWVNKDTDSTTVTVASTPLRDKVNNTYLYGTGFDVTKNRMASEKHFYTVMFDIKNDQHMVKFGPVKEGASLKNTPSCIIPNEDSMIFNRKSSVFVY